MKTWMTPQLIVLVRSRPEEAVLSVCKTGTPRDFPVPSTTGADCNDLNGDPAHNPCQYTASS